MPAQAAQGVGEAVAADRVHDDVDPIELGTEAGEFLECGQEVVGRDGLVGARGERNVPLLLRRRDRDDATRAEGFRRLDGGCADTAGRPMYEDDLAGLDVCTGDQREVRREV